MNSSIKFVQLPIGETYAYRESGDKSKPVFLFLHGTTYSSQSEEVLFKEFTDTFRVVAPDLRGFGETTYNKPITSIGDMADDLKLFCDALELKKVVIAGWSYGGAVALQFAARYPDYVNKTIMINSVGPKGSPYFKLDSNMQPTDERVVKYEDLKNHPYCERIWKLAQDKARDTLAGMYSQRLFHSSYKPSKELLDNLVDSALQQRNTFDMYWSVNTFNITNEDGGFGKGNNEIANIKSPVLIVTGENDIFYPVKYQEESKQAIGEKATLKILENTGHCLHHEKTAEFVQLVKEFAKA